MSESYQPPFHMTEEITNLIVEIGQYVGSITTYETMHQNPVLRRENRIRSYFAENFRPFCRAYVSAYEPGRPTTVRL